MTSRGHIGEQDIEISKLPKLPSGPGPGSDIGKRTLPCCPNHVPAEQRRYGWCVNAEFFGYDPCCDDCPDRGEPETFKTAEPDEVQPF